VVHIIQICSVSIYMETGRRIKTLTQPKGNMYVSYDNINSLSLIGTSLIAVNYIKSKPNTKFKQHTSMSTFMHKYTHTRTISE